MSYLTYLIPSRLLLSFFIYLIPLFTHAADEHRVDLLERAERAIHRGFPKEAESLLTAASSLSPKSLAWREVLRARLLHEGGRCVDAMQLLRGLIPGLRAKKGSEEVLAEAYLEYARICRSLMWVEPYKNYNDSVGMLIERQTFPDHVRFRYFTHRLQYLSLVYLMDKALMPLDSIYAIRGRIREEVSYRYQPEQGIAAIIGFERNRYRRVAGQLCDSIFRQFDLDGPGHLTYTKAILWRGVANYHFDDVTNRIGGIRQQAQKFDSARMAFDRSLYIFRRVYPGNILEKATLLNLKGLLHQKAGKQTRAIELLGESEELLSDPSMSSFHFYYVKYMNAFYQVHTINKALTDKIPLSEYRRQLVRFQDIAELWNQWEDTNRDSVDHYRFNYTVNPHSIVVQLCHWIYQIEGDARIIDTAFQALERAKYRRLRQRMLEMSGLPDPGVPNTAVVQGRLANDEALISTTDTHGLNAATYVMIITRDTIAFLEIVESAPRLGRSEVMASSELLCKDLQTLKTTYHQVWQAIFKPVEPFLKGIRQITILPSGYTSGYYFELMIPDTTGVRRFRDIKYLRDRYRIRYDYSWSIADIRSRIPTVSSALRKNIAFVPDYNRTSYYRLRFFGEMAQKMNGAYDFHVYHRKSATIDHFNREVPQAGLLHLSAHGYSSMSTPNDQYIVMDSLPGSGAYLLNPHHLIRTRTNADLAVLSICLGGLSVWNHQDLRNLAYLFNYAGARSCLYAHWKIDDRSTSMILSRFYEYLADGMNRYDALHTAQDDYLREALTDEELNPIYWGGLTMIGEDGPIPLPRRTYGWAWVMGIIVLWCILLYRLGR
jgi:CHAT domain-containing protein